MNKVLKLYNGGDKDEARWCPLCASNEQNHSDKYSLDHWNIVSCTHCEFVYLANPIIYEEQKVTQAWEINFEKENTRRREDRPVLDRLSKSTRFRLNLFPGRRADRFRKVFKQGRVLDLGCGLGSVLPKPLIPHGIEISKKLANQADAAMKKRGGSCVHADAISGIGAFPDEYFNGILLNSFLEHEVNPLPLLSAMRRVMKDGGRAYVRVPNYSSVNRRVMGRKWCGFRYPDHVNYFTPRTLRKMAAIAGYNMRIVNWATLMFDDNIKAVLQKTDTVPTGT